MDTMKRCAIWTLPKHCVPLPHCVQTAISLNVACAQLFGDYDFLDCSRFASLPTPNSLCTRVRTFPKVQYLVYHDMNMDDMKLFAYAIGLTFGCG